MSFLKRPTAIIAVAVFALGGSVLAIQSNETTPAIQDGVMPQYDDERRLLLPEDYREWRFVGSSLGLSYTEGMPSHEMFHHTLMEPSAYEYFTRTGRFREGTMLVLMLHGTGEGELPQRRGRFAAEIHGIEMAVKDSHHLDEVWGYYNFGGMDGIRERVHAMPADACNSCHAEHARYDNVFTQFYPLLEEAGPDSVAHESAAQEATESVPVAVKGLDPVMLVDGREEMGKPEIEMYYDGYRYQFVSEPTRARFEDAPDLFSIQNDTCLVVPGAELDPRLFAVHDGRIYAFATEDCEERFNDNPSAFLTR